GQFLNNADTGTYRTTYIPKRDYYNIYPTFKQSTFANFDLSDSFDIALSPKPNINDLEIDMVPLSIPRPGFDGIYRIVTKNVGTTNLNNVVIGLVKDSRQTYVDASRIESGSSADSIWWGPISLQAFETDTLFVLFNNAPPPALNFADTIELRVTANPVINDSSINNNVFRLRELVRGSFDPNDKTEIHAGTFSITQYAQGDYLQYQIRFQNTGTDTAFFITVKDTLQSNLDLSTLEVLSASHPYSFKLKGNIATWDFKNILLPDSTTDEFNSHGFITFKVKPKTGLTVGSVFSNKAAIYFDYNLPVITNEDNTIIGTNAGVCPNGNTAYIAGLTGSSYQWQVNNGTGYTNISNGGIYSGATTATLLLTGATTNLYGNKYRCLVNGNTYSPEYILKFSVRWTGAVNTAWENPANWNCNVVPDAKTEVTIPIVTNYPMVNVSTSCYSLRLLPGSTVTTKTGINLIITGRLQ
ncbi:MAG: DUF7619 domain-containing protein, partial [Ferruginibacter sp.]